MTLNDQEMISFDIRLQGSILEFRCIKQMAHVFIRSFQDLSALVEAVMHLP